MTTSLRPLEKEEQAAQVLGMLLRNERAEDAVWLRQAQKELLARLNTSGARRSEPLFENGRIALFKGGPQFSAQRRSWGRNFRGAQGWAIAAALCALLLFALTASLNFSSFSLSSLGRKDSAITFVVEGERLGESTPQSVGRVRAPKGEDRKLAFSDGSILKLEKGGSLRVRETSARGALVVIEEGLLESQVKPLAGTSWSVFAGPYEIVVTGTRFSTQWDPKSQNLIVLLNEGSVQVVGAGIENHVALKPGQRFEASPRDSWRVTAQQPTQPDPPASEKTLPEVEPKEAQPSASLSPLPSTQPSSDWPALLSHGKFTEIVEEARNQGLETCYETCSLSRLRALADAARYSGEVDLAKDALLRLRSRSPSEAARAGYLLGSLSEARGQAAQALSFYNGYLREAPAGALAAEALAGKMRALHTLGRKTDAERAANDYLRLHPSGTSAATARKILSKK